MNKNPFRLTRNLSLFLLAGVVLLGAFFRFYGIRWDQDFHLHPDERFLTMVATAIRPVPGLGEYFDTQTSSLNPHNILDGNGNSTFPFFVYGTLPLFIVRYVGELLGQTGYAQIHIVGRYLSGIFDLGTIVVVYLTAAHLFPKRKWVALIAALLYACAVLPIQISHYFIVDNFTTFFSSLAIYACVRISLNASPVYSSELPEQFSSRLLNFWRGFRKYALFSVALGLAAASKINAVVIAFFLPAAVLIAESGDKNKIKFKISKLNFHNIFLAAALSLLVFRIFQPYAFSGPGFFNFIPNPRWINNLKELSILSSGDSNYPPSLQWARRSLIFPVKNLAVWGLGLPLGVFSISGLVIMCVRVFKGEWKKFGIIFLFTASYLVWQVSLWNPTMRYFLLIYPFLAIIAAWFLDVLLASLKRRPVFTKIVLFRITAISVSVLLIVGTLLWASAFLNVYRQPMPRIAASEWIYENVEGAVNLRIHAGEEKIIQPLANTHYALLNPGESFSIEFRPEISGDLTSVQLDYLVQQFQGEDIQVLYLEIMDEQDQSVILRENLTATFKTEGDSRGKGYEIFLTEPRRIQKGHRYVLHIHLDELSTGLKFFGPVRVAIQTGDATFSQSVFAPSMMVTPEIPYVRRFMPIQSGEIQAIQLFRAKDISQTEPNSQIHVMITDRPSGDVLLEEIHPLNLVGAEDFRGKKVTINLGQPIQVQSRHTYEITLSVLDESSILMLNGGEAAKETDWDDALPLFMHGLNPFDNYEGVYPSDLNFQMYWDDNQEKLDRFLRILNESDYIFITSNRQWGSTTQIEERYPLTMLFYKELIGCPLDDVQKCYRDASPDLYEGRLGFDLVKTFQTNPQIIGLEFNSQYAEEAFTVYDHPKVLIFRKNAGFNIEGITEKLGQVDLNHVLNLTPREAEKRPGNLMMSESRQALQAESGTWADLFDTEALINTSPAIALLVWYGAITLLGWLVLPLVLISFAGLPDKGVAILKPIGLLILSLLVWWAGSLGLPVTRSVILLTLIFLFFINVLLFLWKKDQMTGQIKALRKHLVRMEILSLVLFIFFLAVRLGNPDLWHPYKGGEKPMDFSYLNAVIKSVNFPPYDPWFAGGYINYYYYGFVLAAVPIKFLGIIPSVGYNLILASFFSFTGLAAFSLLYNLAVRKNKKDNTSLLNNPYLHGSLGVLLILVVGNLGTIRMIFQGFQRIAIANQVLAPNANSDAVSQFFRGIKLFFNGYRFPYHSGDWYWIPSRAIPGEPITEFPFFTFLYGDPHAHLFAYPFTLISLGWSLSMLYGKIERHDKTDFALRLLIGAAIVGGLYATNTWDYPLHLVLASVVLFITFARVGVEGLQNKNLPKVADLIAAVIAVGVFILGSNMIYYPFLKWFGQGYSSARFWSGDRTPLGSYLIQWGLFLFIISGFLVMRSIKWLSGTPLSFVKPFYRHRKILTLFFLAMALLILFLIYSGLQILVVAFPLILLCILLFVFDGEDTVRRIIYFLLLVAFSMTVFVEVAVLEGDIGRMNTVFKFYLQAWTLFGIVSALILPDLIKAIYLLPRKIIKNAWIGVFGILFISVLLFPVIASTDKISDRMSKDVPLTFDGMEYMKYSNYLEGETLMDLEQDYHAIRWMQENVLGTPVIVEANIPEYRWGNRFTKYAGLPGVLGWNWHQRQQRTINPAGMVFDRLADINSFYSLDDVEFALRFIRKYNIEYIIVGQLERAVYPQEGLAKFLAYNQQYWQLVYSEGLTDIYRVTGK